jgi:hypothetical protein
MNVAIYQKKPWHTEVMGVFMELCKLEHIKMTIYNEYSNNVDYIHYYCNLFNYDKKLIKPCSELNSINAKNHDIIIFTTAEDSINYSSIKDVKNKIIFVDHGAFPLRIFTKRHIVMSPLVINKLKKSEHFNDMRIDCMLPIIKSYNNYTIKKKNVFGILGYFYHCINNSELLTQRDALDLIHTLDKFKYADFEIEIYLRVPPPIIHKKHKILFDAIKQKSDKVTIFWELPTNKLVDRIRKCKFLLPLAHKGGCYHTERLTGILPMAISNNIPLVVDLKIKEIYNLKGVLVYKESLSEAMAQMLLIDDDKYENLIKKII